MEEEIWIEDPETNDGSMILTDGAQDEYNRIFDEIEELFL